MIRIYPDEILGAIKPIHGTNLGPVDVGGVLDLTESYRRASIPSVRTHDCRYCGVEAVDLHYLFPNPKADPDDPASYYFAGTDDYLKAIRNTGAEIYFRLGESIEHQPTKQYILPDRWGGPDRMARVCLNIVRHYNDGWADGFHWNIKHWEFWNEPDLGWNSVAAHRKMWVGTTEQFLEFYQAAATLIKRHVPNVLIGLAGFASASFAAVEGETGYLPSHPYRTLLQRMASEKIPVDFISWHRYASTWENISLDALHMRRFMDSIGLQGAQSHLSEWDYLPRLEDGTSLFSAYAQKNYQLSDQTLERTDGPEGAAFLLGVLTLLQDLPVDMAHQYCGTPALPWGMFRLSGAPKPKFAAFEVFSRLLAGNRLRTESDQPQTLRTLAAEDSRGLHAAIAHLKPQGDQTPVSLQNADLSKFHLREARQLGRDGWKDINVSSNANGLTLPLAEPGITTLNWEKA